VIPKLCADPFSESFCLLLLQELLYLQDEEFAPQIAALSLHFASHFATLQNMTTFLSLVSDVEAKKVFLRSLLVHAKSGAECLSLAERMKDDVIPDILKVRLINEFASAALAPHFVALFGRDKSETFLNMAVAKSTQG
jgi:hypothetical protein